jgi:hypothetical protein
MPYTTSESISVTLACTLVVALYAGKRYNTPETNRLSTTRALFLFTGAGYIAASLASFFLLSEVALKPGMLAFLGLEDAQKYIAKFSAPPVLAAVLLTTLLPNVAVISTADTWLLRRFQAWGRIRQGIRNLADSLTPASLPIADADIAALRTWITRNGDVPDDLATRVTTAQAESASGSLTRVLWLYLALEKLAEASAYKNSFRTWDSGWQSIRAHCRIFAAQSLAFFVLFDQLISMQTPAAEDTLQQARDRYRDISQTFYSEMAEFLAQLLLTVEGSGQRIRNRLHAMGFCIEKTCPPLPVGPLLFMGTMMIIAILGVVGVVPPTTPRLPLGILAVLIGATQTLGVMIAILPKLRWSFFRPDDRRIPPYIGWLVSSGTAGVLAFVIDRTSIAIAHHELSAGLDFGIYPLSPMGPMAFAVSLSIAIICDLDLQFEGARVRRITEGMLCGIALVTGIFICIHLLELTPATRGQAPPWFPFAFSFSLGFASGFIAPTLYRRARGDAVAGQLTANEPEHSLSRVIASPA